MKNYKEKYGLFWQYESLPVLQNISQKESTSSEENKDTLRVLFLFFYKFIYFIYLSLAALSLRCYARAFSSCGERGLLFVAVLGLLIAVASFVEEHGL